MMKLVVDSNVLISALVRDSVTRKLIFCPLFQLYAPSDLFAELDDHREELERKTGLPREDYAKFVHSFYGLVTLMPRDSYARNIPAALNLLVDPDDAPFVAAAMSLREAGGCGIWSNDRHVTSKEAELLKMGVSVWTTEKLYRWLLGKPIYSKTGK